MNEEQLEAVIEATINPKSQVALQTRLKTLKEVRDNLKARKEAITKPLKEAVKSANDLFRPIEEKLDEADQWLRQELLKEEERRQKEQDKIAEKVAKGKISIDESMDLVESTPKGLFRTNKVLKIVDEKKIPHKYWVIDEVAIRAALVKGIKVSGAVLVDEKTVVVRY